MTPYGARVLAQVLAVPAFAGPLAYNFGLQVYVQQANFDDRRPALFVLTAVLMNGGAVLLYMALAWRRARPATFVLPGGEPSFVAPPRYRSIGLSGVISAAVAGARHRGRTGPMKGSA